jgi:hypothetical protein
MKTKNIVLLKLTAIPQSSWLLAALMSLTLVIAVLGVTGCAPHH